MLEMQPNPTKLRTRASVTGTHPKSSASHDKPRQAKGAGRQENQDSHGRLQRYPYLGSEQNNQTYIDNRLVNLYIYLCSVLQ